MSSRFLEAVFEASVAASLAAAMLIAGDAGAQAAPPLRVCADPNNLPFSNQQQEGFENRIAELVAGELGTTVEYTWWAQRRGFIRNTLGEERCDMVLGVPAGLEMVTTTRPYYRSTYVFVTRADMAPPPASLDDQRLRTLRIGVQMIGDDGTNTPPAHALARRGIITNVSGYLVYGDYSLPSPAAAIIEAVARGDIDIALAWGPMAAYFAARQKPALTVAPIAPERGEQALPFIFEIAMGVRKADAELRDALQAVLDRRRSDIDAILREYGVPRSDAGVRPVATFTPHRRGAS